MNIKLVDNYFSETLKWTTLIVSISLSGYFILTDQYQWSILWFIILSLISFSTKYVLEVDVEKKVIMDSFYFLWIRIKSDELQFYTLNCVRLDKQRHIYNASTRSRERQADFNEYIGILEYDHEKAVELARNIEYQFLAEDMQRFARQLNIPMKRTF